MLSYQFKKAKFSRSFKSSLETESKEDVTKILYGLEKDVLLLVLIPITFHEELGGEIKTFNLFVEKPTSINIIWDLILL